MCRRTYENVSGIDKGEVKMEDKIFNDEESLLIHIRELAKNPNNIYRGYNKDNEIYPQLIRNNDLSGQEFELLSEFEKYGLTYFSASNDIEFLSTAQHYGLPTRLLDFTLNPFIALFFAIYNSKEDTDSDEFYKIMYCDITKCNLFNNEMNPTRYEIKKAQSKDTHFLESTYTKKLSHAEGLKVRFKKFGKFNKLCVVKPNFTNTRITMQQGLFVVPVELEKEKHKTIIETNTHRILIHKSLRQALLNYLNVLGFNTFRLMPDLPSICSAIKNKYC